MQSKQSVSAGFLLLAAFKNFWAFTAKRISWLALAGKWFGVATIKLRLRAGGGAS